MLETPIKSIQQFSMLAKVLGILLLFVLTSCPLKASIKQSLNPQANTEQKGVKVLRSDYSAEQFAETCSSAIEQINGAKMHNAEIQFQPALISFGMVFLLALFVPQREETNDDRNSTKLRSIPSLIQFSRLNL